MEEPFEATFLLEEDNVLIKIFSYLEDAELIKQAALVCKKWKQAVFYGYHRPLSSELYSIIAKNANVKQPWTAPLLVYRKLYKQNLLSVEMMTPRHSMLVTEAWNVTKHTGPAVQLKYFAMTRSLPPFLSSLRSNSDNTSIREKTYIMDLSTKYSEVGLTHTEVEKILNLTPDLELKMTSESSNLQPDESNLVIAFTVAMDDGSPVLAPYNNTTGTAYTREALYVQSESTPAVTESGISQWSLLISGYPKEVRRIIVSVNITISNAECYVSYPCLSLAATQLD